MKMMKKKKKKRRRWWSFRYVWRLTPLHIDALCTPAAGARSGPSVRCGW